MRCNKRTIIMSLVVVFFFVICFGAINCDLPVHCKREQIEGEWIFRINNDIFNPDLNEYKTTCGHGFPDRIEKNVGDINYSFDNYRDVNISLGKDYKIYEKGSSIPSGNWTPIYDEGFIVYYKKFIFTAFMKYFLKEKTNSPKPSDKLYMSNCDKTMIGWVITDSSDVSTNWSCFFGFKSIRRNEFSFQKNFLKPNSEFNHFDYINKKDDYEKSDSDTLNDLANLNEKSFGSESFGNANKYANNNFNIDDPELESFLEINLKNKSNMQMKLWLSKYEEQKEIINEINSSNISWKAEINDEFKGLSFFQLKEKIGIKKSKSNSDAFNLYSFNKNSFGSANNKYVYDSLDAELNEDIKASNFFIADIPIQNNQLKKKKLRTTSDVNANFLNLSDRIKANDIYGNTNRYNKFQNNQYETFNLNKVMKDLSSNYNQGREKKSKEIRDRDGMYETDFTQIGKYFDKELTEIDENTLPKNWDWRNIGGINYVPDPRKQGDCGSCYIFSLTSSLESRLRILTNNKDKTEFSRQYPVSCSFYTEGCDGGYPILVAKFFNEFEIIPESCFPYQAKNLKCSNVCDYKQNPIKYYVSRYEYLGGFYGATNEVEIMKELRARGPIPGNMTVPWSFSYYKSGIFSEKTLHKNSGKLSKTTLLDKNLSWSSVDHSILLVGYGEENGIKYWIGMNTWGRNWGENGFFRILRGENDCNIETMGDAARIAFKRR